jgi:hypothetical protein
MSTLSMRIMTYLIKYISKFEFIFETILDYESGDQMGHRKSHAWAPLTPAWSSAQ